MDMAMNVRGTAADGLHLIEVAPKALIWSACAGFDELVENGQERAWPVRGKIKI